MAAGPSNFETTLWTQVLLAASDPDSEQGKDALGQLCSRYWFPIYSHIRRRNYSPADAEDLTQGFFAQILASGFLQKADAEKGRFRNYLLGALRNYLGNERERQMSQRRGGSAQIVRIDTDLAEEWLASEPSAANDATAAFDRAWATSVLHGAVLALREEQSRAGKGTLFEGLKDFLQRSASPGEYEEIGRRHNLSKGAVAAAVHRLNERYGALVKKAVRDTIAEPSAADDELRFLFSALR